MSKSNKNSKGSTGYQQMYAEYFSLCQDFRNVKEIGDHETMVFIANAIQHNFDNLSKTSKQKALDIMDLTTYDFEEAINFVPIEDDLYVTLTCGNIGEKLADAEEMFGYNAA